MTNTVKSDIQPYAKVILVKRDGTEESYDIKENGNLIVAMVNPTEDGQQALQIRNAACLPAMNLISEQLEKSVKEEMRANAPEGLRVLLDMLDEAMKDSK